MVKFLIKLALKLQRAKFEFYHKAGVKLTAAARWHEAQVSSADAAAARWHEAQVSSADAAAAEKFDRALTEAKVAKQISALL